jgi:hypothetical protein
MQVELLREQQPPSLLNGGGRDGQRQDSEEELKGDTIRLIHG